MNSLANPIAQTYWWSFDVAYEQQSGDAMLVWDNGSSGTEGLSYSTWDGGGWTGITTITTPLAGEPQQMQLAANPHSDEMVLVVSNSASPSQDYALVWDGTGWGNGEILSESPTWGDRTDVYVAYEQQSGRAMAVYGQGDTEVYYRTWDGSEWSSEGKAPKPDDANGKARWTTLGADPASNRMALGVLTSEQEVWLSVWDGAAWSAGQLATESVPDEWFPGVAVAFESQSGQALATYAEDSSTVRYRTWPDNGEWSSQKDGPDLGENPNSMMLDANPNSDQIMLSVQDNGLELNYVLWNGGEWNAATELTGDTGESLNKNQPFVFVWGQHPAQTPGSNWLYIAGDDLDFTGQGVLRQVDLSVASSATLTFNYQRGATDSLAKMHLEVSADGGSNWTRLATYDLNTSDPDPVPQVFDLTPHVAANTQIRFIGEGQGSGTTWFSIDDVQIAYLAGAEITVAVVDSGVYLPLDVWTMHQALDSGSEYRGQADFVDNGQCAGYGQQFSGYCFLDSAPPTILDAHGHGSHIAGTIVNPLAGHSTATAMGIALGADILSIRVLGADGRGTYEDVIEGIQYAVANKDAYNIGVLNLSLSAYATTPYFVDPLNRAVEQAWASGIVVLAAAGNEGPALRPLPSRATTPM